MPKFEQKAYTFVAKPLPIEAIKFNGKNFEAVKAFTGELKFRKVGTRKDFAQLNVVAEVYDHLHDTWVGVKEGQWIAKGMLGEFYPIAPAVFDQKYELKG